MKSILTYAFGVAALSVVGIPTPARSQAATDAPPRIEASAQFSFLGTQGNASAQSLGVGADVGWRPTPWTYRAKGSYANTQSDGDLKAESVTALGRASRELGAVASLYAQYDFLRDLFAGLEQRHLAEGGLSIRALNSDLHKLRFDLGAGYLHELGPTREFDSATLSLGAAYRYVISKTSDFTYEPKYRLPLAQTDAWKFDHDAALAVALNTILSMKLTHTLHYTAVPPPGFKTTDTILSVSLVAKLQRAG